MSDTDDFYDGGSYDVASADTSSGVDLSSVTNSSDADEPSLNEMRKSLITAGNSSRGGGGEEAIPTGGRTQVADASGEMGGGGEGGAPFIPYHPSMNTAQRKMIDHLNSRIFQQYKSDQQEGDRERTRLDGDRRQMIGIGAADARQDRSLRQARELHDDSQRSALERELRGYKIQDARDLRERGWKESDHERDQKEGLAKEERDHSFSREQEETRFSHTPEGMRQKEDEASKRAIAMADDKFGSGGASDDAAMRRLQLGVSSQDEQNKRFSKPDGAYATNEYTPDKPGMSEPYAKALDLFLKEKPVVPNNQRSDGSAGVDPYANSGFNLSDPEKRGILGLATSIGSHNPATDPHQLTRAIANVAYNPNVRDFGVDPKTNTFYVNGGPGKPGIAVAMSPSDFKQLMAIRRQTDKDAELRNAIQQNKRTYDENLSKWRAGEAEATTRRKAEAAEDSRKNQTPFVREQLDQAIPVSGGSTSGGDNKFLYDELYGSKRRGA
jgi:hypothetical protein